MTTSLLSTCWAKSPPIGRFAIVVGLGALYLYVGHALLSVCYLGYDDVLWGFGLLCSVFWVRQRSWESPSAYAG